MRRVRYRVANPGAPVYTDALSRRRSGLKADGGRPMFTSLMSTRRFAPLFLCQFFAAFGDNFLKTALGFVILFHIAGAYSGVLIQFAAAVFIAPYFFLSGLGGELADRYDKAWVAQRIKFVEIGVAVLAVA